MMKHVHAKRSSGKSELGESMVSEKQLNRISTRPLGVKNEQLLRGADKEAAYSSCRWRHDS
jgi:type IV secretory pathway VirD2 relaxase